MKKRIAILIPTIKAGGAEKQAVLLAALLSECCEVHFITLNNTDTDSVANTECLASTKAIRHVLIGNVFSKCIGLKRILLDNKISILFNYLTMPNVIGSVIGRLVGISKVYNGIRNSRLPHLKLWIERTVHNKLATASIFNCYSGVDYFSGQGFSRDKCVTIPNCYPDISDAICRTDKKNKTIIIVGRFVPQKDYETAIKAVSELYKARTDFNFYIVGYGELESEIRNWVSEYGIEPITTIYHNPYNIHELLQSSDIYLSTSLFEGTSNSIMEAMDKSLPVVCTNVGDNPYLVEEGVSGFLSKIRDYVYISDALNMLLDDVELRNKFGMCGNERLRKFYSVERFTEKYKELL